MPDANKEHTINQLVGAAFGAAGQRCMALCTAVFVGKAKEWIPEIAERARQLSVNEGMQKGADLGPLISPEAKQRVLDLVQGGVDEGAKVSTYVSHGIMWCKLCVCLCVHVYMYVCVCVDMYVCVFVCSWCWMDVKSMFPTSLKGTLLPQRSCQRSRPL